MSTLDCPLSLLGCKGCIRSNRWREEQGERIGERFLQQQRPLLLLLLYTAGCLEIIIARATYSRNAINFEKYIVYRSPQSGIPVISAVLSSSNNVITPERSIARARERASLFFNAQSWKPRFLFNEQTKPALPLRLSLSLRAVECEMIEFFPFFSFYTSSEKSSSISCIYFSESTIYYSHSLNNPSIQKKHTADEQFQCASLESKSRCAAASRALDHRLFIPLSSARSFNSLTSGLGD